MGNTTSQLYWITKNFGRESQQRMDLWPNPIMFDSNGNQPPTSPISSSSKSFCDELLSSNCTHCSSPRRETETQEEGVPDEQWAELLNRAGLKETSRPDQFAGLQLFYLDEAAENGYVRLAHQQQNLSSAHSSHEQLASKFPISGPLLTADAVGGAGRLKNTNYDDSFLGSEGCVVHHASFWHQPTGPLAGPSVLEQHPSVELCSACSVNRPRFGPRIMKPESTRNALLYPSVGVYTPAERYFADRDREKHHETAALATTTCAFANEKHEEPIWRPAEWSSLAASVTTTGSRDNKLHLDPLRVFRHFPERVIIASQRHDTEQGKDQFRTESTIATQSDHDSSGHVMAKLRTNTTEECDEPDLHPISRFATVLHQYAPADMPYDGPVRMREDLLRSTSALTNMVVSSPEEHDILLGRGNGSNRHPGNVRFRSLIQQYRHVYKTLSGHEQKTTMTQTLLQMSKGPFNYNGKWVSARFLRFCKDLQSWKEVDEEVARLKVSHLLRVKRNATPKSDSCCA